MIIIKNTIETEKINLVLENKGNLIDKFDFNNETINFLKRISKEYSNLCINKKNSIEDMILYQNLLNLIERECDYCYKLTRDIKHTIKNMKKGVYRNLDIIEIENDMIYIDFIISYHNRI